MDAGQVVSAKGEHPENTELHAPEWAIGAFAQADCREVKDTEKIIAQLIRSDRDLQFSLVSKT